MFQQSNGLKLRTPLLILLLTGGLTSAALGCKATGNESVKEDAAEAEGNQEPQKDSVAQTKDPVTKGERVENPDVSEDAINALVTGNTQFALDLYAKVAGQDDNVFFSPFSISEALAMVSAGARGETEAQILKTLHLGEVPGALHPAFNALDARLMNLGEAPRKETSKPFQLTIANAIWGQIGDDFKADFIHTLGENYGAGLSTLDFANSPETARQTINTWVEEKTQERIKDLLAEGAITGETRLVLTNAIYFKASWLATFQQDSTKPGEFTLRDGSKVTTDLMHQQSSFEYAQMDGFQAISLPYDGGDASMLVLLPQDLEKFEQSLSPELLKDTVAALEQKTVNLTLPKFEFTVPLTLNKTLQEMGMVDAFGQAADFSGMTDDNDIRIDEVIHKAFVSVDESGTEAAAATAITMRTTSMPIDPVKFSADKPFIFVIRDNKSQSLLFVGRLANPTHEIK